MKKFENAKRNLFFVYVIVLIGILFAGLFTERLMLGFICLSFLVFFLSQKIIYFQSKIYQQNEDILSKLKKFDEK